MPIRAGTARPPTVIVGDEILYRLPFGGRAVERAHGIQYRCCNLPREGDLKRRAGIEEMRQRARQVF